MMKHKAPKDNTYLGTNWSNTGNHSLFMLDTSEQRIIQILSNFVQIHAALQAKHYKTDSL